jgi:hypothetical protein
METLNNYHMTPLIGPLIKEHLISSLMKPSIKEHLPMVPKLIKNPPELKPLLIIKGKL